MIEERAQAERAAREQEQAAAQRRRQRWEAAVRQAREAYLSDHNRGRVLEQAERWRRAHDLRRFATEVQTSANQSPDETQRQRLTAWAEWARQEADRLDPLRSPDVLGFDAPEEIDADELDAYMPAGMTVRHPPATASAAGFLVAPSLAASEFVDRDAEVALNA